MLDCAICKKPIEGVDQYAAITAAGGKNAHFACYYPNGISEPLPLPQWAIRKIADEKPELAANFKPN